MRYGAQGACYYRKRAVFGGNLMSSARAHALQGVDRYFYLRSHGRGASREDLRPIFALRYAIYCKECGFLPTADYPDGLELDEFDQSSAQFSAVNEKEEVVGTSRLVFADTGKDLPLMSHCSPRDDFEAPPADECAEVSRLAVHSSYRRRKGDTLFGVNETELSREPGERDEASGERRANAPLLVLGLYREMYCYSRRNDIRYWYAAMEASLARVLSHFGFRFQVIGERQDYYGPVRPYLGDLLQFEKDLKEKSPDLLAWFQSPLSAGDTAGG